MIFLFRNPGWCLLLCLLPIHVIADVQITYKDSQNGVGKITLSKKKARFTLGDEIYVIADYKKAEASIISKTTKQAQLLSIRKEDNSYGKNSNVVAIEKGKGPRIDDYKTTEYELQINNRYCATVYTSTKLGKYKRVKKLIEFLSASPQIAPVLLPSLSAGFNCSIYFWHSKDSFKKIGMPLKLSYSDQVFFEATKIKTKKKVKSSYYKIPKNYQITDQRSLATQKESSGEIITERTNAVNDDIEETGNEDQDEEISSTKDLKEKAKKKTDEKKKELKEKLESLFD